MIKKIIYVHYSPLTKKVISDFYINDALLNNYNVEYWDISYLVFPELFNKEKNDKPYEFIFKNYSEFKSRIKIIDYKNSLFIICFTYRFNVLRIFFLLSLNKCKTGYFARGSLPVIKSPKLEYISRIISFVSNPNKVLYFLKNKSAEMIIKTGIIKPYTVVFNAGFKGVNCIGYNFSKSNSSNFININYFDYDDFLLKKSSSRPLNKKYCVFHDEYLPLHPDFSMLGIKTVPTERYYEDLNRFFDLIEKKFNVQVVIAAHPKAEKYKNINLFNKRRLFFNKIGLLIKFSEFSILHGSSSVSYSILNLKSCIFITSDSIKYYMPTYNRIIRSFAELLGQSYININSINSSDLVVNPIDTSKYDSYKYNYLTSKESENQLTKEIFLSKIINL